jgi:hypothetical protein
MSRRTTTGSSAGVCGVAFAVILPEKHEITGNEYA